MAGTSNTANKAASDRDRPDVRAIMAEIRERVKAEIASSETKHRPLPTYNANANSQASRQAGELLHSDDLRYLNQNHAYATKLRVDAITSHRRGVIGKLLVKAKQKFVRMLRYSLLKEYFASEAEFHVMLVRFLNDAVKYIDGRDGSIFWELIRKLDYDLNKAMARIDQISDEQSGSLRTAEKNLTESFNRTMSSLSDRLGEIEAGAARHESQLRTLDSVARGLEGLLARSSREVPRAEEREGEGRKDLSYVLLENRYRGSEDEIRARLSVYVPLLDGAKGPVLDIGCGRGELLALLNERGMAAYGVDVDPAMVELAVHKGLDARFGDGIAHLRSLAEGSLGGVIAIQVVEHLSSAQLRELFDLCRSRVKPGGKVIFETVNPTSLVALSSNYFRDPTHVFPLHPDTLSYAMTLSHLRVDEVKYLSPVPPEALLKPVPVEEFMTPRWARTVELINRNLSQLNTLLYGHQDFAVIASVPGEG